MADPLQSQLLWSSHLHKSMMMMMTTMSKPNIRRFSVGWWQIDFSAMQFINVKFSYSNLTSLFGYFVLKGIFKPLTRELKNTTNKVF